MAQRNALGRFIRAALDPKLVPGNPTLEETPVILATGTTALDLSALYNSRYVDYCHAFPVTCEPDLHAANAYAQRGVDKARAAAIYNANFTQFVRADDKNLDPSTSFVMAHRYSNRMVRMAK